MAVESAADRAAMLADFGLAASYTPPGGGSAVACTAILDQPGAQSAGFGEAGFSGPKWRAMVCRDAVAPVQGGGFAADGKTFKIVDVTPHIDGVFIDLALARLT